MEENQESPQDLSRTKTKNKKTKYGRYTNDITKEEIEANYDKSSEEAAVALGVGTTILKRLCRKFGIQRWPYRRTNSQNRPKELYNSQFYQESGQESPSEALKDPPAVPPSLALALPSALALAPAPPAAHGNLDSVQERGNQLPTTIQAPVALQVATTNSQERKTTPVQDAMLVQESNPTPIPALGNESPPSWQPAAVKIAPPPVVIVTGGAEEDTPLEIPDNPGNNSLSQVLVDTISSRFPAPNTTTTSTTTKTESFAPPPPIPVSNHHPNGLSVQNPATQPIINGSKTIYSGQAPAPPPPLSTAQDADVLQELAMQLTLALHQRGIPIAGVSPLQQASTRGVNPSVAPSVTVPVAYPPMRPPPMRLVQPPPPPPPPSPPTELETENELIVELASYHVDDEDVVRSLLARAVIEMHARVEQAEAVAAVQAQSLAAQQIFGVGAPRVSQHVERAESFSFDPHSIAPRMQDSGYHSWLQGQGPPPPSGI